MHDVKWIRLTLSMFDDEKIRLIEAMPDADAVLVIWVKLLVQAGRTNANGYIFLNESIPYTDEMLATLFNRPLNTVRLALEIFKKFEMIEWDDSGIAVLNWEKHQNVDGLDKIRAQGRERVRLHRAKQKLIGCNATCNDDVTLRNAPELELELELEKEKNRGRFTPPTHDQVKQYCHERNNTVDPNRFIDFYESKGWMVGKNKMKDWRAAVRNWERGEVKPQYKDMTDDEQLRRDTGY